MSEIQQTEAQGRPASSRSAGRWFPFVGSWWSNQRSSPAAQILAGGHVPVRAFNLTRWFAILGLAAIVLISTATGVILSRFLAENMLRRDAEVSADFIQSVIQAANDRHSRQSYHTHVTALDHFLRGDRHETSQELTAFLHVIAGMPDVLRANVYSQNRTIIWSSHPELLGKRFEENHELEQALAGELVIERGVSGNDAGKKSEHVFFDESGVEFVENYVPIWDVERKSVVGVVELYKAPASLFRAIQEARRMVWIGAVLGGIVLFCAFYWLARRADGLIRLQQERLIESETYATVGEVAMAVAHGLRNPLASIRSSAELALEEEPSPALSESLLEIVAQSDRLEGSVRELLGYSRPGIGSVECIDIADVAEVSVSGFTDLAKDRDVTIVIDSSEALPHVWGDAAALCQALNSVLSNALEAMPTGGEIVVSTGVTPEGDFVELTVADTGPGLADGTADEIFEPFVTTKSTGIGLGLPLARRIVERHSGSLGLATRHGGGTLATIRIPVAR